LLDDAEVVVWLGKDDTELVEVKIWVGVGVGGGTVLVEVDVTVTMKLPVSVGGVGSGAVDVVKGGGGAEDVAGGGCGEDVIGCCVVVGVLLVVGVVGVAVGVEEGLWDDEEVVGVVEGCVVGAKVNEQTVKRAHWVRCHTGR